MQEIGIVFDIAILIMSVVIHEVSHGLMANYLGDPTAKYEGRLTLNPLPHLDLVGSVILPAALAFASLPVFGYAKPVPYNPYNLRNQRWGPALVGLAGPGANIFIGIIFAVIFRFVGDMASASLLNVLATIIVLNIWLAIFNLIPIPPLDGSKALFALLPAKFYHLAEMLESYGFILLLLLIFVFQRIFILPLFFLALFIARVLMGG